MHVCTYVYLYRLSVWVHRLLLYSILYQSCVCWRIELMALHMLSTDWATSPVLLFLLSIKFIVHLIFFEKESHNAAQDGLNSSTSAAQVPKLQACTTMCSFMYLCYFLKTEFQVIQTGPIFTAKDDLELLTFLLPPPKCIDGHHSWLYVLLGLTPRTSSRLGKYYINWGTPPGLSLLLIDFPWLPWVIVFSQGVLSLLSGNGYRKNRDLGSPRCILW